MTTNRHKNTIYDKYQIVLILVETHHDHKRLDQVRAFFNEIIKKLIKSNESKQNICCGTRSVSNQHYHKGCIALFEVYTNSIINIPIIYHIKLMRYEEGQFLLNIDQTIINSVEIKEGIIVEQKIANYDILIKKMENILYVY